jgi:hypothetical protein
MAAKRDISTLLKEWPFQPGQINARMIQGNDGEPRIQVRLDLGILQMQADGRPDGERPFGFSSLLEYHEARVDGEVEQEIAEESPQTESEKEVSGEDAPESADSADQSADQDDAGGSVLEGPPSGGAREAGSRGGPGGGPRGAGGERGAPEQLQLSSDECRALREEAAQFYQRYVACLALEDFERVIRDTTRNLRVIDLCAEHATNANDRSVLEQFRPYVVMLRARALASASIKDNELKAAVVALDEALDALKRYFASSGSGSFEQSSEVRMLRDMREALVPKLPISQKMELRERLQRALETENYELAAILRDELKQLKE